MGLDVWPIRCYTARQYDRMICWFAEVSILFLTFTKHAREISYSGSPKRQIEIRKTEGGNSESKLIAIELFVESNFQPLHRGRKRSFTGKARRERLSIIGGELWSLSRSPKKRRVFNRDLRPRSDAQALSAKDAFVIHGRSRSRVFHRRRSRCHCFDVHPRDL